MSPSASGNGLKGSRGLDKSNGPLSQGCPRCLSLLRQPDLCFRQSQLSVAWNWIGGERLTTRSTEAVTLTRCV